MRFKISFIILSFFILIANTYAQLGDIVITTKLSEQFLDKSGKVLTGKGVIVGDVDSGIDVFHPFYFFADGGEFNWIDDNDDGKFTPGKDAVDMNNNGEPDGSEVLRVLKMANKTYGMLGAETDSYIPDMDFLYMDKNNNKKRDFGTKDGFNEQTPSFGEQLFIVIDANKNNKLDAGEKLVALKTSKVRAVREKDGKVRRRGVDLIMTEPDTIQHGTHVASIVMGGHYGVQRIHGIAPDAEMVFANIDYDYTPRFVRNFPDLFNFIKSENVNIILLEDGEFVWEFMDGSTEEEEILNQMARDGITVIGGGGNLAGAKMHIKDTLGAGESETYSITCPEYSESVLNNGVFPTLLWRNADNNLSFQVTTPDGNSTAQINGGSEVVSVGKYNILYAKEVSPKGTVMVKMQFSRNDSGSVAGNWGIKVTAEKEEVIDGFIVDISQSWAGTSHWNSHVTDEGTVTFPPTADSCIAVGAYTVNYPAYPGDVIGALCQYSGIGYNITGKMGIDICAPGHITFAAAPENAYDIFSGTSSAAPHVVGAAVLMLQYDPTLTHTQIRNILLASAKGDNFTGSLPNTNWGYGKLDTEAALRMLTGK